MKSDMTLTDVEPGPPKPLPKFLHVNLPSLLPEATKTGGATDIYLLYFTIDFLKHFNSKSVS